MTHPGRGDREGLYVRRTPVTVGRSMASPKRWRVGAELFDRMDHAIDYAKSAGLLVETIADESRGQGVLLLDTDEDGDGLHETATAACEAGVAYALAWTLAYRNDETFGELTPEQRHADFLAWLNENIAESIR